VTFGSFNNPAKLNARVLALWGEILRRVPGARLLFRYRNWFANAGLRARVRRACGSDVGARIDFEADQPWSLALYNDIDIALDPFPFAGAATTFDALWMGVPVITLLGATIAARQTVAMARAVKLSELIAVSPEDYVAKAVGLAGHPDRLAVLRAGLRTRVAESALCDGRGASRTVERLLRAVWRRWCGAA
jgi:protein O-GlcNAc transferase